MGIQVANVDIQESLRWRTIFAETGGHTSVHEGATELIGGDSSTNGNSALGAVQKDSTWIDGLEVQLEEEVSSTPDSTCGPVGNSGIRRTRVRSRGRTKRVQLLAPGKRNGW